MEESVGVNNEFIPIKIKFEQWNLCSQSKLKQAHASNAQSSVTELSVGKWADMWHATLVINLELENVLLDEGQVFDL